MASYILLFFSYCTRCRTLHNALRITHLTLSVSFQESSENINPLMKIRTARASSPSTQRLAQRTTRADAVTVTIVRACRRLRPCSTYTLLAPRRRRACAQQPNDVLARLRTFGMVGRRPRSSRWAVFRHLAVLAAARDHQLVIHLRVVSPTGSVTRVRSQASAALTCQGRPFEAIPRVKVEPGVATHG